MNNKVVAVVAEFNPFHNGHLYQLEEIKKNNPSLLIALISPDYVQRGEISILTKEEKTKIALELGYDMIVELPSYYALQNADIFAKFSTKILDFLKVDFQVFGVENDNLEDLEKLLKIQEDEEYQKVLKENLKKGKGYINSHKLALEKFNLEKLYKSNNILAISYIKCINQEKLNLKYMAIKRKNVGYNSNEGIGNIASATFIRENFKNLEEIEKYVPKNTFNVLKNKKIEYDKIYEKIFLLFKYILLNKEKEEILKIYDFTEAIYNRMIKIVKNVDTYDDFLEKLIVRNISENRIKRLIFNTLLCITKEDIENNEINYVRILGINSKAAKYIKSLNNDKIFVNFKDLEKNVDKRFVNLEKRSFQLIQLLTQKKEKLNIYYQK